MNIENAELLSYDSQYQYLGDSVGLYRVLRTFTLRSRVDASTFGETDSIWTESGSLVASAYDWADFSVNNVVIANARVLNFSFESGLDVQHKSYSMTIESAKEVDISYLSTPEGNSAYSSVASSDWKYIENISENFSTSSLGFAPNGEKRNEKSRSLDFSLSKETGDGAVTLAKSIIQALFVDDSAQFDIISSFYPSYYASAKRRYKETYDLENFKFSISESFSFSDGLEYDWSYSTQTSIEKNGLVNVTQSGTIVMLDSTPSSSLQSLYASLSGNIQTLANDSYVGIAGGSGVDTSGCPLSSSPVRETINYDPSLSTVSYSQSFTNDQSVLSGYRWTYTTQISQNGNYSDVQESGELASYMLSGGDPEDLFSDLLSSYRSSVFPGIYGRAKNFYDGFVKNSYRYAPQDDISLVNSDETYREREGGISYSFSYTDDPSYRTPVNTAKFSRVVATSVNTTPQTIANVFDVPGNAIQTVQYANQTNMGSFKNQIVVTGKYSDIAIGDYLSEATAHNDTKVFGYVSYLENMSYSFEPQENRFTLSVDYKYMYLRSVHDLSVWGN